MNDPSTTTTTFRSEPGGGRADPTVGRFVFLFVTGLVVVSIAVFGRREVSRWYQATAENAIREQRYEDAVLAANKALEWDPSNDAIVNLRAIARQQSNDFAGSVADFDELIAKAAEDGKKDQRDIVLLQQKAAALHRLGRYPEVLAIWDEIIAYREEEFRQRDDHDSRYDYALALNNRAYMVAQAFSATQDHELYDIEQGLAQVRRAIEVRQVDDDAVILDTLGYLLLLNDQPKEALETLEKVVELTKAEHAATRAAYLKMMQKVSDQRQIQDALRSLDEQFAIILHHRGEAYAANGDEEKSAADIAEALRLGYNPDDGIW